MERNNQLSNNTYKRQLIAEKRKTNNAMEEIQSLRELVEELTNKLKVDIHKTYVYQYRPHIFLVDCARKAECFVDLLSY